MVYNSRAPVFLFLSPKLQTRHHHRPILINHRSWPTRGPLRAVLACRVPLYHKIDRKAQPSSTFDPMHIRIPKSPLNYLRIVRHYCNVIPSIHQSSHFPRPCIRLLCEDLHHVLFDVGWWTTRLRAMPILRDVNWFVDALVEELEGHV